MHDRSTRREFLTATGAVLSVATAGCVTNDASESITVEEDFESELTGWETNAHVGPEADDSFEWSVERSQDEVRSGEWSLAIFTEGRFDDGTAWIVRPINVEPGRRYHVEASIPAWSESESFNVVRHLVAYLGPEPPKTEEDFPEPGWNSTDVEDAPVGGLREPLDLEDGWREYGFEWETPELESDTLYFAVGNSVVWEADRTHYVDDLELTLRPE